MQCPLGFLETLDRDLRLANERGRVKDGMANYVVVWANVSFYHTTLTSTWFTDHPRGLALPLTYRRQAPARLRGFTTSPLTGAATIEPSLEPYSN